MFEYLTAGESHGPRLTAIIKSLPSGLEVDIEEINDQLFRRQQGYGRGGRMKIESDKVIINSGLRHKKTLGSPMSMTVENKDWENWIDVMAPDKERGADVEAVTNPRPGHADLPGALKYNHKDIRNVLERASARETAARTAVGAVSRQFLEELDIKIYSHVVQIGSLKSENWSKLKEMDADRFKDEAAVEEYFTELDKTDLRCGSESRTDEMKKLIDSWRANGDSVGGVFEIIVRGLPVGIGSHVHWDLKLESKLAAQLIAIQAMKGIEIGAGFKGASLPGSKVHDEIYYDSEKGYYRKTNQAGGIEGGMSNGEELVIRLAMKPIPTLATPLHTADIISKEERTAAKERTDVCAVPAASIVGEAVTALVLAQSTAEKFGGDSMTEILRNYNSYKKYIEQF